MYYADFIDVYYFFLNIFIARNYIIISGAAYVLHHGLYIIQAMTLFFFENEKKLFGGSVNVIII